MERPPTCRAVPNLHAAAWLPCLQFREANLAQGLWLCLVGAALPMPLKHAAWAYGVVVAALLATLPQQRALSLSLCPATDALYSRAARALAQAAACVLPSPLGALVLQLAERLGRAGVAFYAIHAAGLLASHALLLRLLLPLELAHRRTFVRQRCLATEAAGLLWRQQQWRLGLPLSLLLGALAWCICCCVVLLPQTFRCPLVRTPF